MFVKNTKPKICLLLIRKSEDGILAHLKKIKSGDIVLVRIVDMILSELASMRNQSACGHLHDYPYKEFIHKFSFDILAYQTYNNFIVASDEVIDATRLIEIST